MNRLKHNPYFQNARGPFFTAAALTIIVFFAAKLMEHTPTEVVRDEIAIVEKPIPGSVATDTAPANSAVMLRLLNGDHVKASVGSVRGLAPGEEVKVRVHATKRGDQHYRVLSRSVVQENKLPTGFPISKEESLTLSRMASISVCSLVSGWMIFGLWRKRRSDSFTKKVFWSTILLIPLLGWLLYGALYTSLERSAVRSRGNASGWEHW